MDWSQRREPYKGFNDLMLLNGWYWEPYGSVIEVHVQGRNLIRIGRGKRPSLYKTLSEFRIWLNKMGYEKEDCNAA